MIHPGSAFSFLARRASQRAAPDVQLDIMSAAPSRYKAPVSGRARTAEPARSPFRLAPPRRRLLAMGLLLLEARFPDPAPDPKAFERHLERLLGSLASIDTVELHGQTLRVICDIDAVAEAYTLKAFEDFGGERVDGEGRALPTTLPDYVRVPWPDWPRWKRAQLRLLAPRARRS